MYIYMYVCTKRGLYDTIVCKGFSSLEVKKCGVGDMGRISEEEKRIAVFL